MWLWSRTFFPELATAVNWASPANTVNSPRSMNITDTKKPSAINAMNTKIPIPPSPSPPPNEPKLLHAAELARIPKIPTAIETPPPTKNEPPVQFVAIASPSPTFLLIESSSKPAVLPPVSQCALRACPIRIRLHSTDMQIPQWHRHRVQSLLRNADRESRLCSFFPCAANKNSSGQPIKCSVMFINRAHLAWCSE